ncbi:YtxH domain-containing protein [Neobacillus cucumis]|uniref:YtxH domain-containing protein n=1 Tax=Neobacillus cucumis TaxID=1740721 RepID=UPI0028532FFD|nr:YtxH domain-containing protein [Neobacillus cucumis]MDR4945854.1 YtxH domain-containing protein [Neobacillus cucumis]
MKVKPFLLGFMTGGLAAGISILLTAPNSGKVTRRDIKKSTQRGFNQLQILNKNLMNLKDAAVHASTEGRAQIAAFLSEVKIALAHWEEEVRPQQQQIQQNIIELKETIHKLEEEIPDNRKI